MKSLLRHERSTELYSVIKSLYKSNSWIAYTKVTPQNGSISRTFFLKKECVCGVKKGSFFVLYRENPQRFSIRTFKGSMDTMGNLIWFSKQDFRTLKRFFKFMEPFLRVRYHGFSLQQGFPRSHHLQDIMNHKFSYFLRRTFNYIIVRQLN